ncbi:MAG: LD-carboxypeptidase [Bacteroidetes bacterium]|nr:LD-carboxypeptidase [Bacteroidota bacterium]
MDDAVNLLQSWGLEVVLGETVTASYHQFAGDDELRARDMQKLIDDDDIRAIIAARGGYGAIRIVDHIDFNSLKNNPKWLVGFSDITVLHAHLFANYRLQTIHGQMPINIPDASKYSLETLRKVLFGNELGYSIKSHHLNRTGTGDGLLIGGNLSLLVAVLSSVSDYSYDGKILFVEDVGEYLYSIDRMFRALDRAGKLKNLTGLIVGGFTELKDNDIPFGQTVPEIIMEVVKKYDYPVCFDFPAGHIPDNQSLIFGRELNLSVQPEQVVASYVNI